MSEEANAAATRLLARVPAVVYLAWLTTFLWLLGGRPMPRYRAYLHPNLWPFLILGVTLTLFFLASALFHRPSPHGVLGSAETGLRGILLLLPLLFLGVARQHALGTYALQRRAIGLTPTVKRTQRPATEPASAVSADPATSVAAVPASSVSPAPTTKSAPEPSTATPAAKAPAKPISLAKLTDDIEKFKGTTVLTEGLVYKGEDIPGGYILVFRFIVTCCIADAQPVGVLVAVPNAAKLENDDWVSIVGRYDTGQIEGEETPFIKATAVTRKKAPPPEEQYLYY